MGWGLATPGWEVGGRSGWWGRMRVSQGWGKSILVCPSWLEPLKVSSTFPVSPSCHSREPEKAGHSFQCQKPVSLWVQSPAGLLTSGCCFQVQSIEFTQIEMKVMEGLQVGNECLNKMHQVGPHGARQALRPQAGQAAFVPAQDLRLAGLGTSQCLSGTRGPEGGVAQHSLCAGLTGAEWWGGRAWVW